MIRHIAIVACGALLAVSPVFAQSAEGEGQRSFFGHSEEFALGVHYAHIELSGDSAPLDEQDGIRFEGRWSTPVFRQLPQVRVGCAIGLAYGSNDADSGSVIVDNGQLIVTSGSREQRFTTVEPELQLSWRQPITKTFFIEPGVAAGWLFGYYTMDLDASEADKDIEDWSNTWTTRAFLRAGFQVPGGFAGLEGGYLQGGELEFFDSISGDVSEFYVGIWGALLF